MSEIVLELISARKLHIIDVEKWTGSVSKAYLCEWNHRNEISRSLQSIVDKLALENWNRFITPGSTLVDIGGYTGDTAIPMALFGFNRRSLSRAKVIVVEPNPSIADILKINLALNSHLAEFILSSCAITNQDLDEVELSDHSNANCNGGIIAHPTYSAYLSSNLKSVEGEKYKVRGLSIETLVRESGINDPSTISFIKTDCEGYDKEVLKGCGEFLSAFKPTLFVEWFDWFGTDDSQDLFDTVNRLGYVALNPISLQKAQLNEKISDILCVHYSRFEEFSLS